jgi:hypothetical protein
MYPKTLKKGDQNYERKNTTIKGAGDTPTKVWNPKYLLGMFSGETTTMQGR